MNSFAFGFPPDGHSVDPCRSDARIPNSIREEVIRRYEAEYPNGYILAFWDSETQIFGFYTRTKEIWKKLDSIDEIVLFPIKPSKGLGFLIVGSVDTNPGWPEDFLLSSSRYTEPLHAWIRSRAERLAALIGKPFREAPTGADC